MNTSILFYLEAKFTQWLAVLHPSAVSIWMCHPHLLINKRKRKCNSHLQNQDVWSLQFKNKNCNNYSLCGLHAKSMPMHWSWSRLDWTSHLPNFPAIRRRVLHLLKDLIPPCRYTQYLIIEVIANIGRINYAFKVYGSSPETCSRFILAPKTFKDLIIEQNLIS